MKARLRGMAPFRHKPAGKVSLLLALGLVATGAVQADDLIKLGSSSGERKQLLANEAGTFQKSAKLQGFIFYAQEVRHATSPKLSVRLGETISPQTLKTRFSEYDVRYTKGEGCLTCAVISGADGRFQIDFAQDGRTIINISSSDDRSRDAQGNSIGSSLLKALGSNSAHCDAGMDTTCASLALSGLSYIVADDDRCPIEPKEKQPTNIPACARITGFQIQGD